MRNSALSFGLSSLLLVACSGAGMDAPSLASGTEIKATTQQTISSKDQEVGATLAARVAADLTDENGEVVIPAGSTLNLGVSSLKPASGRERKDGAVSFNVESVTIGETTHEIDASVGTVAYTLKGRGIGANEVGTAAAGAVVGGVIGSAVGDKEVVGALAGGAVGAAVADQTADRDVVVASGTQIVITLNGKFSAN